MDLTKADLTHFRDPGYLLIPPSARLDADRALKIYSRHLVRQVLPTGPPRWWALNASRCLLNRQKEKHSVASRNFSHIQCPKPNLRFVHEHDKNDDFLPFLFMNTKEIAL